MLDFSRTTFYDDPYPFGVAESVFAAGLYADLVRAFPPETIYAYMGKGYHKFSLSERNNPAFYQRFIADTPCWREVHHYVKSQDFLRSLFQTIEKGLGPEALARFGAAQFRTRFEFSSLPADGGYLLPHTDIASKVLTLVIPMYLGYWDSDFGGGTDVLRPKDPSKALRDYEAPLDEFDLVASVPYLPNQCMVFIKSATSWHSVGPIRARGVKLNRRTITLNVERVP